MRDQGQKLRKGGGTGLPRPGARLTRVTGQRSCLSLEFAWQQRSRLDLKSGDTEPAYHSDLIRVEVQAQPGVKARR